MQKQLLFIITTLFFVQACGTSQGIQRRSNDEYAVQMVKELRKAQSEFLKKHNRYGLLNELCEENLLPEKMADEVESGYKFNLTIKENRYAAQAVPQNYGTAQSEGNLSLYLDESGVIRSATKKGIDLPKWEIAGAESVPIKEQ